MPVPVTVTFVAAAPAATLVGLKETIPGTGLFTENEYGVELPPPGEGLAGFTTVSCRVPAAFTLVAGKVACKKLELIKAVDSAMFPMLTTD
jgi:hypothetical protein